MKRINSIYYCKNDENCLIYLNLKNILMKTDLGVYDFLEKREYLKESSDNFIENALMGIDIENKSSLEEYKIKSNNSEYKIKAITLFMTYSCNLRCTYCYEGRSQEDHDETFFNEESLSSFISLLKELPIEEHCTLIFFGGEPLINFNMIKKVVESIKLDNNLKDRFFYSITTNATLLDHNIVKFLEENKFAITISIDGNELKTNVNRKTASGEGAYNYIVPNIKLLKNFNMIGRVTITDSNMDLIDNHKHLYELGFNSIAQSESYERIKMINYSVLNNEIKNYYNYFMQCLHEKDYTKCSSFKDIVKQLISIHLSVRQERHCGAGVSLIAVTPDVKIIPCQRFLDKKLGDNNKSFIELCKYDNKYNKKYKCNECIAYSTCSGGCYHSNIIFEDYDSSNSPFCKLNRTKITNAIKVYSELEESEKEILFAKMY
ncbi:4Fe-4S cluster-binding domain-containing protein [Peptoniphilus equinus]|uniref:4Fe-4S cluster-binding domain-containing protein n=1 Tax=Peptoniphilus equinus TaxID=3016343 RepID=A0ABY7QRI2_9FIRM|nr:radical SAM protein [Peptoniphilus equinus]WBW49399.1 4Fe-4S cluster-binding domain-containing protein [Peptoniphilus equinus]